jgi:two-component system cell cycle response regulator DivK
MGKKRPGGRFNLYFCFTGEAMPGELILIIEDNEKNLKLVRDLLQVSGYQTLESITAEDGILVARESQPALILMDIQLPGMSGIEALEVLRADPITKNIPVIAVTASAMIQDRQEILAAGFNGYQRKPIELKGFLDEVRSLLEVNK